MVIQALQGPLLSAYPSLLRIIPTLPNEAVFMWHSEIDETLDPTCINYRNHIDRRLSQVQSRSNVSLDSKSPGPSDDANESPPISRTLGRRCR